MIYKRDIKSFDHIPWEEGSVIISFVVTMCGLEEGQKLCVLGDTKELAFWDYQSAIELTHIGKSTFKADVKFDSKTFKSFNYKYLVLNHGSKVVKWEDGANRTYIKPTVSTVAKQPNRIVFTDMFRVCINCYIINE